MLQNDFFKIIEFQQEEHSLQAILELDPGHRIFEGHFPGQPVLPGVCMMQMQKELLQKALGKKTRLVKADHAKFLSMIDPRVNRQVKAHIRFDNHADGTINLNGSFAQDETVFFKYKAVFAE
jgi:3-hydroxyacyl-[acyl-carrier-protein] dehydratase